MIRLGDSLGEAEIARRRDEIVKRVLATPPQPKKPDPERFEERVAKLATH